MLSVAILDGVSNRVPDEVSKNFDNSDQPNGLQNRFPKQFPKNYPTGFDHDHHSNKGRLSI